MLEGLSFPIQSSVACRRGQGEIFALPTLLRGRRDVRRVKPVHLGDGTQVDYDNIVSSASKAFHTFPESVRGKIVTLTLARLCLNADHEHGMRGMRGPAAERLGAFVLVHDLTEYPISPLRSDEEPRQGVGRARMHREWGEMPLETVVHVGLTPGEIEATSLRPQQVVQAAASERPFQIMIALHGTGEYRLERLVSPAGLNR